ncbi:hypothetical protein [Pseudemcibacter aquimaris]|uniref:hypothetical protein n=1 Tax=Pseudemcibacter aquimaris TaxID=2857064 RepID=UPI0020135339|nr:hypothetical protein [Pseudemcibacter aquimaris]MCC3860039.1 hypothetical protein [Pseudemcibacter aquimaris]WDU57369.1 hypothetical protein KW060_09175 [Pseudemcibacter aquimaris]
MKYSSSYFWIIIFFFCGLIFYGFWSLAFKKIERDYPSYKWNQKLEVEVDTPEGMIVGASVVRAGVLFQPTFGLPEASRISETLTGEATIVELPNEKYLFVLLGDPVAMAQHSFKAEIHGSFDARMGDMIDYYPKLHVLRTKVPLLRDRYPLFVTFDDLNDPASVKLVDPDDLVATFGEGYTLKSVTLEITDEEVTSGGVEKVLPWINSETVLKNPTWRSLPTLSQKTISGLKKPIGNK